MSENLYVYQNLPDFTFIVYFITYHQSMKILEALVKSICFHLFLDNSLNVFKFHIFEPR